LLPRGILSTFEDVTLLQKSALAQAAPLWRGLHRNDELPGEMAIAARAGVGRTVVRGLLRSLGRRGYLARRGRKWVLKRPLPAPSEGGTDRAPGPRSKKDLVKEHLLAELTGGGLKPGQRVVELALARKLGVSTAVVREALLELHPLGAFVKKERRHWQVTSVNDKQLEALREFREMVEVFALRRLFERPPCPLVAESLARNRRRTEEVLASRKSTIRELLVVDLEFHRLLLEASGNPLLPERAGFIYLIIEFQLVSPHFRIERGRFGLRQHLRIHRSLEKGRPDLAESALRRHLQAADESICAIARRMRRNGPPS
jgi:DNA-binding GntR family transcriptional regulator